MIILKNLLKSTMKIYKECLKNVKSTDVLIIMVDMNVIIGVGKYSDIIDRYSVRKRNDKRDRLIQFYKENHLEVCNTYVNVNSNVYDMEKSWMQKKYVY